MAKESQKYGDKTCLVIDNGLFCELAVTLAKSFGTVFFYSPWESSFPKSNSLLIGKGIPGVTRVDDFWGILDDVDLVCFPDVYFGPLQIELEKLGKRIWGSRMGEELELDRVGSKETLRGLGFPIGEYQVITGLDALREFLQKHNNWWVKISKTRGDFESFHSQNYKLIEPRLDELEHNLGAKKKITEFVVEKAIDDAVEVGYDCYTVDGKYPTVGAIGIEVKDKGYIGHIRKYNEMPEQIKDTNAAVAPLLKQYRYRNFLTLEQRIVQDGTPYVIDPCCRQGSPPSELLLEMYTNIADIMWHGAAGELIDPEFDDEWGAELLIHSAWADRNWQAVQFPEELRDHIKLRNLTIIGKEYYVVPQSVGLPEIGAVVATGKTLDEAVERVKEIAEEVQGYYLDIFPDALDEAQAEIDRLKSFGIEL